MALIRDYRIVDTTKISTWNLYALADISAEVIGIVNCSILAGTLAGNLVVSSSEVGSPFTIAFGAANPARTSASIQATVRAALPPGNLSVVDGGGRLHIKTTLTGAATWIKIVSETVNAFANLGYVVNQYGYGLTALPAPPDYTDQPGNVTAGIEAFHPADVVYYRVDNRPLLNLIDNDNILNNEITNIWSGYNGITTATRSFIATEGKDIFFNFYNDGYDHIPGAVTTAYASDTGIVTFGAAYTAASIGDYIYDDAGNSFKIYATPAVDTVQIAKDIGFIVHTGGGSALSSYIAKAPGRLEIYNDLYIAGDLIIQGQVNETTVTELLVEDKFIHLNINETSGGVTGDISGMIVDRGSLPDVGLFFDESLPAWSSFVNTPPGTHTIPNWLKTNAPAFYNETGYYTNKIVAISQIHGYFFGGLASTEYIYYDSAYELLPDYGGFIFTHGGIANSVVIANNFSATNYFFGLPAKIASGHHMNYVGGHFRFMDPLAINSIVEAGIFDAVNNEIWFGAAGTNLTYTGGEFHFEDGGLVESSIVGAGRYKETANGINFEEIHKTPIIVVGNGVTNFGDYNGVAGLQQAIVDAVGLTGKMSIYVKSSIGMASNAYVLTADLDFNNVTDITMEGDKDATIKITVGHNITIRGTSARVKIKGFNILIEDNAATPLTDSPIAITATGYNIVIEDCYFSWTNTTNPTAIKTCALPIINSSSSYITIKNCIFRDNTDYITWASNFTKFTASSFYLTGNYCTFEDNDINILPSFITLGVYGIIESRGHYNNILNNKVVTGDNVDTIDFSSGCLLVVKDCNYNFIDGNNFIQGNSADSSIDGTAGGGIYTVYMENLGNNGIYNFTNNYIKAGKTGDGRTAAAGAGSTGGYEWIMRIQNTNINISNNIILFNIDGNPAFGDGGTGNAGAGGNGGSGNAIFIYNIDNVGVSVTIKNVIINNNYIGFEKLAWQRLSGNGGNASAGNPGFGGGVGAISIYSDQIVGGLNYLNIDNLSITDNTIYMGYGDTGDSGTSIPGGAAVGTIGGGGMNGIGMAGIYTLTNIGNIVISNNNITLGQGGEQIGIGASAIYNGEQEAIGAYYGNPISGNISIMNNAIKVISNNISGTNGTYSNGLIKLSFNGTSRLVLSNNVETLESIAGVFPPDLWLQGIKLTDYAAANTLFSSGGGIVASNITLALKGAGKGVPNTYGIQADGIALNMNAVGTQNIALVNAAVALQANQFDFDNAAAGAGTWQLGLAGYNFANSVY